MNLAFARLEACMRDYPGDVSITRVDQEELVAIRAGRRPGWS